MPYRHTRPLLNCGPADAETATDFRPRSDPIVNGPQDKVFALFHIVGVPDECENVNIKVDAPIGIG